MKRRYQNFHTCKNVRILASSYPGHLHPLSLNRSKLDLKETTAERAQCLQSLVVIEEGQSAAVSVIITPNLFPVFDQILMFIAPYV